MSMHRLLPLILGLIAISHSALRGAEKVTIEEDMASKGPVLLPKYAKAVAKIQAQHKALVNGELRAAILSVRYFASLKSPDFLAEGFKHESNAVKCAAAEAIGKTPSAKGARILIAQLVAEAKKVSGERIRTGGEQLMARRHYWTVLATGVQAFLAKGKEPTKLKVTEDNLDAEAKRLQAEMKKTLKGGEDKPSASTGAATASHPKRCESHLGDKVSARAKSQGTQIPFSMIP